MNNCNKLKCTYNETGCSDCELGQMINRLNEYESIGLNPKQILKLKEDNEKLLTKLCTEGVEKIIGGGADWKKEEYNKNFAISRGE